MRCLLPALLLLLSVDPILAQPARGPLAPGKNLPGPFHAFNATGPSKDRYHCLVSEYNDDPVVLIFARGLYDNEAFRDLLARIEAAIARNPTARLRCFVVFLPRDLPSPREDDDKREELARVLDKLAEEAKLKQVILCLGSKTDLGKYGLDDAADLTVVLYRKFEILASFAVPADKVDAALVKSVVAELGPRLGATR